MFKNPIVSAQTRAVLTLAREKHWGCRVLTEDEMIREPVCKNGWWFIPVVDESTIPPQARGRVDSILKSGVRPQGLIVAHEAPKVLAAPGRSTRSLNEIQLPVIPWEDIEEAAKIITKVAVGVMAVAATSVMLSLGLLVSALVMVDPALIMVVDGVWIEVVTWYE